MIERELNHSSLPLTRNYLHTFTVIWTADTQLVNFCTCCLCSQPVADASILQERRRQVAAVLAEYEQALLKCRTKVGRREFEDASILQERRRQVAAVLAEYEQALLKCRTKVSRREFEAAIATKHQQLAHINLVLGELQHQTISLQSFNVEHPLKLNNVYKKGVSS